MPHGDARHQCCRQCCRRHCRHCRLPSLLQTALAAHLLLAHPLPTVHLTPCPVRIRSSSVPGVGDQRAWRPRGRPRAPARRPASRLSRSGQPWSAARMHTRSRMCRARCEWVVGGPVTCCVCAAAPVAYGRSLLPHAARPAALPPRHRACSKQIHFGVMSPAEIVNTAEFHVYERALYKASRRSCWRGAGRDSPEQRVPLAVHMPAADAPSVPGGAAGALAPRRPCPVPARRRCRSGGRSPTACWIPAWVSATSAPSARRAARCGWEGQVALIAFGVHIWWPCQWQRCGHLLPRWSAPTRPPAVAPRPLACRAWPTAPATLATSGWSCRCSTLATSRTQCRSCRCGRSPAAAAAKPTSAL